ncbi:hypothetical protein LGQ02_19240 [Bacillus shivajii]|uniref:hypothetical protein n=1 Tax=Bacillus shivajii TaxID=1983719 RepID=UPI001CFB8282|nr:hypothetical protein [Bacillus shivajii]UCZ52889.1 hypothetical protein LGQ02_19240 [Bacillus shivajii]
MDFISILILGSVVVFGVILTIGPIMEMRGKFLFEKQEKPPVIRGRVGMGLMAVGIILFIGAVASRMFLESGTVTPFAMSGYGLWIVGGVVAVWRNELLKFMVPESMHDSRYEEERKDGTSNIKY